MANDLATTDPQAGSTRELARLALSAEWTLDRAIALGEDVRAAIAAYETSMRPLAEVEPLFDGPGCAALKDWLRPIGMKIAPTMAAEQAGTWLAAVVMALADFPAKVASQAARAAIRTPMSFLNEVDGAVRVEAEAIMERHKLALMRLRAMRADIERAAAPPSPAIEAVPTAGDITMAEIRAMPPELRRIGIKNGWLTQAEIDAADAERDDESRAAA